MGCFGSKNKTIKDKDGGSLPDDDQEMRDRSPSSPKRDTRDRGDSKVRLPPSQGGKPVDPRHHMKLGLVGTSSSGKTTLAKQMKIMHTRGFTAEDRVVYKKMLADNLILAMKEMSSQSIKLEIPVENTELLTKFKGIDPYKTPLTPELADSIREYWADKGLQEVYKLRHRYEIPPNTEYCMENLHKLCDPDYVVTEEDILRARLRSTGLNKTEFFVKKTLWELVDPGGQRAERRKWPQFFEGIKGMIYVAALDDWNVVSVEVPGKTKLEESLDVFEDIINYQMLQDTTWILFLNKIDLFEKKILTVDLKETFAEYEGGQDVNKAVEFIKNMYLECSNSIDKSNIKVHVTCALDTTQVEKVFAAVRDFVASESLRKQGLGGII